MKLFVIRHKETGKLMPLMKRGKGYSHWNPAKHEEKLVAETDIPRIFSTRRSAEMTIHQWFALPNATYRGYRTYYGEDDYDMCTKDDGRKKEDLEIIPAELIIMVDK